MRKRNISAEIKINKTKINCERRVRNAKIGADA